MFNQKLTDEKDYEIKKIKDNIEKNIISFNELYNQQLNYFKHKFNLKNIKHKVIIVTYKNEFESEFINLEEAKLYYEDLLKKKIFLKNGKLKFILN